MYAFIASQNDKMVDAINAFNDIINNIPESESAFKLAKEDIISRMRTERITKSDVLWSFIGAKDLGMDNDQRKAIYDRMQTITLKDVLDYQKKWVKGRTYTYCILGDDKDLDLIKLSEFGPIQKVSQEEIFGY